MNFKSDLESTPHLSSPSNTQNEDSSASSKKPYQKKEIIFDYKDPLTLYSYLTEGGKILPARITRLTHNQQKKLKNQIKKARNLNLLPIGTKSYDSFLKPDLISKKPYTLE